MAAATTHLHDFIRPAEPSRRVPASPGFSRRLLARLENARMRQAEREIALLIERRGGRLTDDTEREIERALI